MRAGADLRLLRVAVFSAVCVTLSAIGHVMASGAGIPLWTLAAGWAGVLCAVAPLAGRERSLPGIAATLLAGELGLHLLFCLGQSRSMMTASAKGSSSVVALAERLLCNGQLAHLTPQRAAQIVRQSGIGPAKAVTDMPGMAGMSNMPGMADHGAHAMGAMSLSSMFTPSMVGAHATAALIVGWMLRRGEAAVWRLVRLYAAITQHLAVLMPLRGLLAAVRVLALVAGLLRQRLSVTRLRRTTSRVGVLRPVVLQHCVIRRGPPAVALAA
ncbi:hypothetical protein NGB36_10175 [Streptomyces sp. RB6PN25]|uniref:Integral membrane protein n=1 Tax=Streptomyces humicola TaxID=2953240 RepID=A0ABT1PTE9_9ACTN|nr:hypothetical protein [Streptomyces humicola]MCQ4080954.1 hypothetical protein [Streptomyces humicola]